MLPNFDYCIPDFVVHNIHGIQHTTYPNHTRIPCGGQT
jgi:hypothetical protein